MKNILVGVDFTENSIAALKYAFHLAQYFEAKVIVAHVLDYYEDEDVHNMQSHEGSILLEVKRNKLVSFVSEHFNKQFHSVDMEFVVEFGDTSDGLQSIAKDKEADIILLGRYSRKSDFFQKVSNDLVDCTLLPVFVVPQHSKFSGIKRIVYATDFLLEDTENIFYLLPWLEVFNAELVGLHVCKNDEEVASSKRKLATLKKIFPQKNISFRSVTAGVEYGIQKFVSLSKTDMVAVAHRKRNIWDQWFKPSVSKALVGVTEVPMIIFKQH